MRNALNTRQNPSISTESLVCLGKLVLENNVFEFHGEMYRQKLGTAIGTKFAPVLKIYRFDKIYFTYNLNVWIDIFNSTKLTMIPGLLKFPILQWGDITYYLRGSLPINIL